MEYSPQRLSQVLFLQEEARKRRFYLIARIEDETGYYRRIGWDEDEQIEDRLLFDQWGKVLERCDRVLSRFGTYAPLRSDQEDLIDLSAIPTDDITIAPVPLLSEDATEFLTE